jgi:hypothetical protein
MYKSDEAISVKVYAVMHDGEMAFFTHKEEYEAFYESLMLAGDYDEVEALGEMEIGVEM